MSAALERTKPEDYWKSASFAKGYARRNILGVEDNKAAKEFHAHCYGAICQGIAYLKPQPASILDLGCGHAIRTLSLKGQFGGRVVGADYSPEMLKIAGILRERVPETHKIELIEADATDLPFEDNEFDVVTCYGLLMSLPTLDKAAPEIMRVARHGLVAIEEVEAAMSPEQHAELDKIRLKVQPGRIYWHDYLKAFGWYAAFNYNPIVPPSNWDLGVPPAYARMIVSKWRVD